MGSALRGANAGLCRLVWPGLWLCWLQGQTVPSSGLPGPMPQPGSHGRNVLCHSAGGWKPETGGRLGHLPGLRRRPSGCVLTWKGADGELSGAPLSKATDLTMWPLISWPRPAVLTSRRPCLRTPSSRWLGLQHTSSGGTQCGAQQVGSRRSRGTLRLMSAEGRGGLAPRGCHLTQGPGLHRHGIASQSNRPGGSAPRCPLSFGLLGGFEEGGSEVSFSTAREGRCWQPHRKGLSPTKVGTVVRSSRG